MTHGPAARHSAFYWQDAPSVIGAALRPSNKDRSKEAAARRYSPAIEGAVAGQLSADRRAALRKGSI